MELRNIRNIALTTGVGLFIGTAIATTVENVRPDNQDAVVVDADAMHLNNMFRIQQSEDIVLRPPFIDHEKRLKDTQEKETVVFWATVVVGGLMGATVGHSWYYYGKAGAQKHVHSSKQKPICYNAR